MPKPYPSERMKRVARLSGLMAAVIFVVIVLTVALIAFTAFGNPELLAKHPWLMNAGFEPGDFTLSAKAWSFAAMMVAAGPYLWGMYELWRMFRLFMNGAILTPSAVSRFRRFAVALTLGFFSQPVGSALLSAALSFNTQVPHKFLAVSISTESIMSAMLGVAMIVVGWVMSEAVAVMDENRAFV